ncbi:hypothetical protein CEXT_764431 [Caerostris extrusa]|uniref:Uncharacterized protein n=1 Tax=Caerostris extrusa TaxID=172846 RepID=A0AAV4MLI6_CAEEX|nr:hypothetical protein CEXT_764431 [Caerostris extrusa]
MGKEKVFESIELIGAVGEQLADDAHGNGQKRSAVLKGVKVVKGDLVAARWISLSLIKGLKESSRISVTLNSLAADF